MSDKKTCKYCWSEFEGTEQVDGLCDCVDAELERVQKEQDTLKADLGMANDALMSARQVLGEDDRPFLDDGVAWLRNAACTFAFYLGMEEGDGDDWMKRWEKAYRERDASRTRLEMVEKVLAAAINDVALAAEIAKAKGQESVWAELTSHLAIYRAALDVPKVSDE